MEIQNVSESDVKEFIEVYRKAYKGLEEYAYTTTKSIKSYFRWLLKRDRDGFYKAVIKGEPIGFIACDTNWKSPFEEVEVGEIHEVIVLPRYRRSGVGRELIEKCIEYSRKKGRKICELWVGEKNEEAKKFYKELGFKELEKWGIWIRMVRYI